MTREAAEAGFSIVELLVAVAITSFVVLAIGGLLALGVRVRERVDENIAMQAALVDLQGLARLMASEVGLALGAPNSTGFTLSREAPVVLTWAVAFGDDGQRIELKRRQRVSVVTLSSFDAADLEYLVAGAGGADWLPATRTGGRQPLAARLKLERGERVWRPLLWITSKVGGQP